MSMFPNPSMSGRPLDYATHEIGAGTLSRFMNTVYAWMCVGLAVTAAVAWYVSAQPQWLHAVRGPAVWLLFIAEIVLVVTISRAVNRISANGAMALFLLFAAINGLVLSGIFLDYKLPAIGSAFGVTAGMFGITSVYGMVTKRDLTRLGSLLFMALLGLILATIICCFWASTALYWFIAYAGVAIFVGLTAYHTQRLKLMAYQVEGNSALSARMAVVGSLLLYLDFINLFLFMLQIMGDRRR